MRHKNICIFAENSDAELHAGISKEHLWPQWSKDYFPDGGGEGSHLYHHTFFGPQESAVLEVGITHSKHRGTAGNRKLRVVCQKCNSGWMSGIESAAMGIIAELMLGTSKGVGPREQQALSRWIMLRSVIGEYIMPGSEAISEHDRMYLKNNGDVPPGWRMWIGNYLGEGHDSRRMTNRTAVAVSVEGPEVPLTNNAQATMLLMRELIMYSASMPDVLLAQWEPAPALTQIWPLRQQDIRWPPDVPIGSDVTESIRNYMQNWIIRSSPSHVVRVSIQQPSEH